MRSTLAPAALALAFALAPAANADGLNFTCNTDHDRSAITCADIQMEFRRDRRTAGELVNVRRERKLALPAGGSSPLRVRSPEHGGIRVQPSPDASASALVCFVAGARSEAAADAILDRLQVVNEGGELAVTGPADAAWGAYIVLSVPRDVKLDLVAENCELALHGVSGHFTLRTTNGPISIVGVEGVVDGEAENGPIHFKGHAGDVRLTAKNGPIGIRLDAPTWQGKGLDARTTNGPVRLSAPADLRTGVQVEGSAHSPFQTKGLSRAHSETWARDHTVRLGEGPVLVRLSTVNGPVQVNGPKGKSRSLDI